MFDKCIDKYKRALVIGTGGGNDIVSTLIPVQHLQKKGIKTDIAGILSPAAIHIFNGKIEDVINRIDGHVERVIPASQEISISFVDGLLPEFVKCEGLEIPNFYDFSTRYGTSKLVEEVNKLIAQNSYDLVVAVDVGGDILARGNQDSTLLSPMMDFASLHLLSQLETDVLLVEFGLGTDGELRPRGMEEILNELRDDKLMLYESTISADDLEVARFRNIFDKVRTIRAGHTAVMTLQTLDAELEKDIIVEYRFRSQIGKRKWHTPFEVILSHQHAGRTYLIDGRGLARKRSQTAFSYQNSLEQYVKLKCICPEWKTEMDLFYLWSKDNWTNPKKQGESLFLLTPSTSIPSIQRKEIIQYGVNNSNSDLILLWESDIRNIDMNGMVYTDAGRLALLSRREGEHLKKVADQVKQYQH